MGAVTMQLKEELRVVKGIIERGINAGESLPEAVRNAVAAYKKPATRPRNEVARAAVVMILQKLGFTSIEVAYDPDNGEFEVSAKVTMTWPDPPEK